MEYDNRLPRQAVHCVQRESLEDHVVIGQRPYKSQGYCATDLELEHLIAEADETLFQKILRNPSHMSLLPSSQA